MMSSATRHSIWLVFQVDGIFNHDGKFDYNNQRGTNLRQGKQGHVGKTPSNTGKFGGRFMGTSTTPSGPGPYITTSGVIPQLHKSG